MDTFLTGLGVSTEMGSSKAENELERREAIHCLILLREEWKTAHEDFEARAYKLLDSLDIDAMGLMNYYDLDELIEEELA